MTGYALFFLVASWTAVLSLMGWAFRRILTMKKHFDPDGIGPAQPPEPPLTEQRGA